MVRQAFSLSFARVPNSRPRNSRDIAAQILWLTDFRAKERLLAVYVRVKMYHPTMLRRFARDLSSEKEKEKFLSCVDVHKT